MMRTAVRQSSIVLRLTDREAAALIAPWWRRLFPTAAEVAARARIYRTIREALR